MPEGQPNTDAQLAKPMPEVVDVEFVEAPARASEARVVIDASEQTPKRGRWPALFIVSTLLITGAATYVAWHTGLRQWSYGLVVALGALALGPIIILAIGIGVILLTTTLAAVGALFGAQGAADTISGSDILASGRRAVPGYFKLLGRTRSPVLCAIPAGLGLAVCTIGAVQWWYVLPREAHTARKLLASQQQIERVYADAKRFPEPDALAALPLGNLYPEQQKREAGILTDGFGRAMRYRVDGVWRAASYSLSSAGADGVFGTGDDLCVEGRTTLDGFVRGARAAGSMVKNLVVDGRLDRQASIQAVEACRCSDNAQRVSNPGATP